MLLGLQGQRRGPPQYGESALHRWTLTAATSESISIKYESRCWACKASSGGHPNTGRHNLLKMAALLRLRGRWWWQRRRHGVLSSLAETEVMRAATRREGSAGGSAPCARMKWLVSAAAVCPVQLGRS